MTIGSHSSNRSIPFRSWVYFRTGYAEYFVFIFGVLNTLTLTFYLAIDNYPTLLSVFPDFTTYIVIITIVGFPLLTLLGYIHIYRSSAYRSEVEVSIESDPYMYKIPPGVHQEVLVPLFYETLGILKKADAGEELSQDEIKSIKEIDEKLELLIKGGILKRPDDFGGV